MIVWVLVLGVVAGFEEALHRRFEYKHSFKGPTITDAAGKVPFWEAGGSCMPAPDNVRVTPSIRSKQGWLWNTIQYVGSNWELNLELKIQGRGKLGADGMAIWYVQDIPKKGGSVFGAPNNWRGLGIFFDSFDNDNKHDNPAVIAVANDGSVTFDHGSDGKGQELSSCVMGFRNRPHPAQVRLRYYQQVLTLEMNSGITTRESDFDECFRVENVKLSPGGYFGVSAATGALADDHDIHKFLTYSLFERVEQAVQINEEAKQKILADYEKYDSALEEKKKKYREKNPNQYQQEEEDEQNLFYKSLIDYQVKLSDKFDQLAENIKKLEHTSSGGEVKNSGDSSVIKSSVTNVERMQSSLVRQIESIGGQAQTLLSELGAIHAKTTTTEKELKTVVLALGTTQSQLKELQTRKSHACPALPDTGISFLQLVCVVIIQSSVLIGYWIWRNRVEDARKKFF